MLISLLRHADRVKIACQAQLVNVITPIMTESSGRIWKQTIYYLYLHTSVYGRGTAMNVIVDSPKYYCKQYTDVPELDAIAVESEEHDYLTIFGVNRETEELEVSCCLRGHPGCQMEEFTVMTWGNLKMTNSADAPDRVAPRQSVNYKMEDDTSYSWNVIRIKL